MRVAIIGSGPAGVATAVALRNREEGRHLEVTLYHRNERQRWPVGETLPPAAWGALSQLGLAYLLDSSVHTPCPGSLSVWGSHTPVANDFMLEADGTGFHLDRRRFERDLLAAARRLDVDVQPARTLRRITDLRHGFELGFQTDAGPEQTVADFVVDASGQSASFARRLPIARNRVDEVISLYARLPVPENASIPDYTLLEATPHGWWYLSRIPDNHCILSLTTDKEAFAEQGFGQLDRWCHAYEQARWLNTRMTLAEEGMLRDATVQRATASSAILSNCVGERWLAVGDAACSYDSITSAGITKSLMQGRQAGNAIADCMAGDPQSLQRYQASVFDQFNRYIGLRHYLYHRETRFPGAGFWQRRQAISA
ncbi:NAD(P)/FAD-dependent oxidoreductase [Marinimicrobium agarilyticum]|uniref:NAD(P)/FAD-dependent oxidoreductase n=1 Tax=Marinimicrobium agarilyticum TaxID=306546 RepID=UPI0004018075|nr:tryptophan 7-halogenase [Marinimicrobium agarilyticum]